MDLKQVFDELQALETEAKRLRVENQSLRNQVAASEERAQRAIGALREATNELSRISSAL